MALTDVSVASKALVLIGAKTITAFDSSTTEAIVATELYETLVEGALTLHHWRFATGQKDLSRLAAVPKGRWDAAYQMPTNPSALLVRAVTVNDIPIEYDRYEDKIYCNAGSSDTVTMDYTYRAATAYWPAHFVRALILDLAAYFSGPVTGKGELVEAYEAKAVTAYARAKTADSTQQTTKRMQGSRILSRRRGA